MVDCENEPRDTTKLVLGFLGFLLVAMDVHDAKRLLVTVGALLFVLGARGARNARQPEPSSK